MTNEGRVGSLPYLNLGINGSLLVVELVVIVGVHLQVVEGELLLDPLLESLALFEGQGIGLGNNGNNIDDVREFLQHNDIDRLESECSLGQLAYLEVTTGGGALTHGRKAG